jgi:hypothetical protein
MRGQGKERMAAGESMHETKREYELCLPVHNLLAG